MGQDKPSFFSRLFNRNEGTGLNLNVVIKKLVGLIVLILFVIVLAKLAYNHYHPAEHISSSPNVNDSIIGDYKNSKDINDQRSVISAYLAKGDYNSAESAAKAVANSTDEAQDYMALITICGLHNVTDKNACLNSAIDSLKPKLKKLSFTSAYGAGGIMEKNNRKKDAVMFYQRAYDAYDPNAGGDGTMTKEQLKAHIDELSK